MQSADLSHVHYIVCTHYASPNLQTSMHLPVSRVLHLSFSGFFTHVKHVPIKQAININCGLPMWIIVFQEISNNLIFHVLVICYVTIKVRYHFIGYFYLISDNSEVIKSMTISVTVTYRSSQRRYSVKKLLLEISQNSLENTCARVSFLTKLQA